MFPAVFGSMLLSTIPVSIIGSRYAMAVQPFWHASRYSKCIWIHHKYVPVVLFMTDNSPNSWDVGWIHNSCCYNNHSICPSTSLVSAIRAIYFVVHPSYMHAALVSIMKKQNGCLPLEHLDSKHVARLLSNHWDWPSFLQSTIWGNVKRDQCCKDNKIIETIIQYHRNHLDTWDDDRCHPRRRASRTSCTTANDCDIHELCIDCFGHCFCDFGDASVDRGFRA